MTQCPVCQKRLHRTHRKTFDRVISYVFPVARYTCYNHACRWHGLRLNFNTHPLAKKQPGPETSGDAK